MEVIIRLLADTSVARHSTASDVIINIRYAEACIIIIYTSRLIIVLPLADIVMAVFANNVRDRKEVKPSWVRTQRVICHNKTVRVTRMSQHY